MLTLSESVKYNNITTNPQVSLLIDARTNVLQTGSTVMALIVYGKAAIVVDPKRNQILVDKLVAKYSNLAKLAGDRQCLVIQMKIK